MNLIHAVLSTSAIALVALTQPTVAEIGKPANPAGANPMTVHAATALKPGLNRITFQSAGEKMIGNLYLPASYKTGDKLPAVIVAGSWTTVKEQMASRYAQKLAEQGYVTLAFDFRNFGESSGKARNFESPSNKITDIKHAVTFLQSVQAVDSNRIAGLGICASAGYMAVAAAEDSRIKALIAIAPWIHDAAIVQAIYGGEAGVAKKLAAAQQAKAKFDQTGQVETVPAISTTNPDAAMYGNFDYYLNPQRGAISQWPNQFAVMSWAEWLTFSAMPQAKRITVPTLFIHSETAAIPDGARQFFAAMPTQNKQMVWLPDRTQFDFYDQEATVNQSVDLVAKQLKSSL